MTNISTLDDPAVPAELRSDNVDESPLVRERQLRDKIEAADDAAVRIPLQLQLAQLLGQTGRHAEVDLLLDLAAPFARDSADFLAWQGETKYALERYDDAVEALEKSCAIDTGSVQRWLRLANAMAKSEDHHDRVDIAITGACRAGAADADALAAIGSFHAARLNFDEAARYFDLAIALAERKDGAATAYLYFHLANCQRQLGRDIEGAENYCSALARCEVAADSVDREQADIATAFKGRILYAMDDTAASQTIAAQLGEAGLVRYPAALYLENTPARIRRFESIVAGRDVALLAHGPSIAELESRIEELAGRDICFVGLNRFGVIETGLLSRIDRRLDILCLTNPTEYQADANDIAGFLARSEANLLITSSYAVAGSDRGDAIRIDHDSKLLFFAPSDNYPAVPDNPLNILSSNTPSVLLALLQLARPRRIFFFGGDGGAGLKPGARSHYRIESTEFDGSGQPVDYDRLRDRLRYDAHLFNETCGFSVGWTAAFHGVTEAPIRVVSPQTNYTAFPRMDYDQALAEIGR